MPVINSPLGFLSVLTINTRAQKLLLPSCVSNLQMIFKHFYMFASSQIPALRLPTYRPNISWVVRVVWVRSSSLSEYQIWFIDHLIHRYKGCYCLLPCNLWWSVPQLHFCEALLAFQQAEWREVCGDKECNRIRHKQNIKRLQASVFSRMFRMVQWIYAELGLPLPSHLTTCEVSVSCLVI